MARIKGLFGVFVLCLSIVFGGCSVAESDSPSAEPQFAETMEEQTEQTLSQEKQIRIETIENRDNELVFSLSIDDFIDQYNACYRIDRNGDYLTPSSQWRAVPSGMGIHSEHETILYVFSENKKVWSLPTITVYVPAEGEGVQEVTINFDEHSRTEELYDLYESMCFYAVKVFLPDLNDGEILDLCARLNQLAYDNMYPNEEGYGPEALPCTLYYRDGVGLYPYFAAGEWVHFCIIPVTEETLEHFADQGVEVYEIEG